VSESQIQNQIRVALGNLPDVRLFRNNVGVAKIKGAFIRYGLTNGSADLIGWITLGPPVLPFRVARFMSLEIKTDTGRLRTDQKLWLQAVRDFGGFAAVVRSPEEALAAVERARKGESE